MTRFLKTGDVFYFGVEKAFGRVTGESPYSKSLPKVLVAWCGGIRCFSFEHKEMSSEYVYVGNINDLGFEQAKLIFSLKHGIMVDNV